jgi:hypothetical protein
VHPDSGIASLTQPLLAKHQMLRLLLTEWVASHRGGFAD